MSNDMSLEERITLIEDRIAISQMRAKYSFFSDQRQGDELVALFTEDGEFSGPVHSWKGKSAILDHQNNRVLDDHWHFITNEVIDIDGNDATGKCYCYMPCVYKGESYVCACQYDDVLVKRDGRWKFRSRKVTFYYFVPLAEGWGKERFLFPAAA